LLTGPLLQPAAAGARDKGCPNLVIDAHAGAILDANEAAWHAWGFDGPPAVLPFAVDQAMPALQRLRVLGLERCDSVADTLVFWTPCGVVATACHITRLPHANVVFAIAMLDSVLLFPATRAEPRKDVAQAPQPGHFRPALPPGITHTAALAHEIKTPLGAVMAYAEVLKDEHFGPLANVRYQGYARDIYESARHMLAVVDAMLRDRCVATPEQRLDFADVNLERILDSCLSMVRPLAERSRLALSAEVQPGLAPVVADELMLKQMLLNLLANAIKYARPGDRVCVSVAGDVDGSLHLSVADTGPGINQTHGGDHARKAREPGLGLGLRLTRDMAEANGARLTIESGADGGTRATISFSGSR
jgi:hypothetical protein